MRTDTSQKIVDLLKKNKKMQPIDLLKKLDIKRAALHRQLLKLQEQGIIVKMGLPPRVYYQISAIREPAPVQMLSELTEGQKKALEKFVVITPDGNFLERREAFLYWCHKHNLPPQKTLAEYVKTRKKYDQFALNGLIDGRLKLMKTFGEEVYVDELYYLDFYSLERFGRTKLGQLTLYAKQSQNQRLMQKLVECAKPQIETIISKKHIEALCFVPPTVKREVQLMSVLEDLLSFGLPVVKLTKIRTEIAVPQKTLSRLNDRVENAEATLYIKNVSYHYNNLLLIDDAVGSGATINTAARLLKEAKVCTKITGLALTGSFKGFDVIAEI